MLTGLLHIGELFSGFLDQPTTTLPSLVFPSLSPLASGDWSPLNGAERQSCGSAKEWPSEEDVCCCTSCHMPHGLAPSFTRIVSVFGVEEQSTNAQFLDFYHASKRGRLLTILLHKIRLMIWLKLQQRSSLLLSRGALYFSCMNTLTLTDYTCS